MRAKDVTKKCKISRRLNDNAQRVANGTFASRFLDVEKYREGRQAGQREEGRWSAGG